jgi:hypothetical protein
MLLHSQGSSPVSWSAQAFNQVPDSDNRIHSDQIAKAYGFTGALVPGVTVSSYLIHPAVQAWGKKWLEHGAAHVSVKSPLYDGKKFDVFVNAQGAGYEADLLSEGRQCAHASVTMTERLPPAPTLRGDTLIRADFVAPSVSRALMEALQISGCASVRYRWAADHEMASYLREQQAMPALLRTDGQPGSSGFANMAFLLGCANRHFAAIETLQMQGDWDQAGRLLAAAALAIPGDYSATAAARCRGGDSGVHRNFAAGLAIRYPDCLV